MQVDSEEYRKLARQIEIELEDLYQQSRTIQDNTILVHVVQIR